MSSSRSIIARFIQDIAATPVVLMGNSMGGALSISQAVADPDSVRVSGTGSAGIEIGGVEVQEAFRQPNLSPEYRRIEQELEDLGRQQSLIADRRQSIATLREFLAGLKATGGQESSRDVLTRGFAVESWQKAFDFFSSSLDALSKEERALESIV